MISFILLFAFAFALPEIKREGEIECDENYINSFETNWFQVINREGVLDVYYKTRCIRNGDKHETYSPCTETHAIAKTCTDDGRPSSEETKVELTVAKVQIVNFSEFPLPGVIEYQKQPGDVCPDDTSISEPFSVATDNCLKDETNEGTYYKVSHDKEIITFKYFTDNECKTPVSGAEATKEIECDSCVNNVKYECIGNGQSGENGEEETDKCNANFGKDYKYVVIGEEGQIYVNILNECFDFGDGVKGKYVPCTETHIQVLQCKEDGTTEFAGLEEIPEGVQYAKELPAHIAHEFQYGDGECKTQMTPMMMIYTNDCVKTGDQSSIQYLLDGNKLVGKEFTNSECKSQDEEPDVIGEYECDKCVGEDDMKRGPGSDWRMKIICSEYIPPSSESSSNGSISTFILMILVVMFFIF